MAEEKIEKASFTEDFDAEKAQWVINTQMLGNDLFSQWMEIRVIEINNDSVVLAMTIREEMTNGFKISHGGILYSLCDSALAFAANAYGRKAVTIQTSMSYIRTTTCGDKVIARAIVRDRSRSLARYEVLVHDVSDRLLSIFEGTVFFTGEDW